MKTTGRSIRTRSVLVTICKTGAFWFAVEISKPFRANLRRWVGMASHKEVRWLVFSAEMHPYRFRIRRIWSTWTPINSVFRVLGNKHTSIIANPLVRLGPMSGIAVMSYERCHDGISRKGEASQATIDYWKTILPRFQSMSARMRLVTISETSWEKSDGPISTDYRATGYV